MRWKFQKVVDARLAMDKKKIKEKLQSNMLRRPFETPISVSQSASKVL